MASAGRTGAAKVVRFPWRGLGSAVAFVAALLFATPAMATPPLPASGTGEITSTTFTQVRTAGGNTLVELINTGTLMGTVAGAFLERTRIVFHRSGDFTFTAVADISGSAAGCGAGVIPVRVVGSGRGPLDEAVASGKIITVGAGGEGVDVKAVLDFEQVGTTFTYSGTLHCQ